MIRVSRSDWNARPPDSATPLTLSRVTLFIVHYSGETRDQSVRSIQNYCMDDKGHVDIDYNRLVRGRSAYAGRGWNVGGHTLNHNSVSYGVCVIGRDGDATDDDLLTLREIYDEVCGVLGRRITITDHRTVLGSNHTDCPGDEIHSWVAAGLPAPSHVTEGRNDMFLAKAVNSDAIYMCAGNTTRHVPAGHWEKTCVPLINAGVPYVKTYESEADVIAAGGPLVTNEKPTPTPPVTDEQLERVLRRVLRSVPEA